MAVIIGGKSYSDAYANDPKNQEEMRKAVVGGGNDIKTTSARGITDNITGKTITADSTGRMTSTGSTYRNRDGYDVTPYSERNSIGTVSAGTVLDPNSSSFNSTIANSRGKINLLNQGDYNSSGMFTGANSGSKSEADSQSYYSNLGKTNNNSIGNVIKDRDYDSRLTASPQGLNQVIAQQQVNGLAQAQTNSTKLGGQSTNPNSVNLTSQTTANPNIIPTYDATNDINSLKEYQKQQAQAGLSRARDASLSNLSADREKIAPQYYNNRANTSTASQLGAKNLAEFMASRGQSSAGVAGQSELNRVNQLQGDIGNWNTQEQQAFNDNARSVTNLKNAYESDLASSNAGIEATGMQQLINAKNQQRVEQLAQANADRSYNYQVGRDTVGDSRYNQQYQDTRGDVAYDRNYQSSRDAVSDYRYYQQYADQRGDVAYDRNYQAGRDNISDTNYNNQTKYNQDRDSLSDIKWATEGNYRADQDKINQTGQLADGSYTQSGQINNLNIQQQQAQLKEMQDPNSTTNVMNRLGLQTAQLNFAALPAQLKAQAQQIAQQLQQGAIDMKTAQIKLDYLPRQMQADLNQSQAQTSAANRSNQGGRGSNGGLTPTQQRAESAKEIKNAAYTQFNQAMSAGNGSQWLISNADNIIGTIGADAYYDMEKRVSTDKNFLLETLKEKSRRINSSPQ